ncbi:MAG TPA: sugar ABC transporter permease [Segeticoccus sp.]|uniref:carbohydrate ABC transporter permease n=1 Tax=Segeticoccus sp. TaxID=2706531 RepID=UPI002D7ECC22|nr:sugar ABC transporter permease [Segeticoccus sp.]HET8598859.1 sugar ABC transporter permease [Segeticoccus sp.]
MTVQSPTRPAVAGAGQQTRRRRRLRLTHWVFVGPGAALFAIFFAYPLVASLLQSLQSNQDGRNVFVGLQQYQRMLHDPLMAKALLNTGLILVVQVPVMIGLALVLAAVLNNSWRRFRTTLRIAYFLPAVTTLVAYSIVFRVLLKTDGGVVNQALQAVGLHGIDWLNSPGWARIALIASITWRWTGYNMVILLAGLQAVPKELYEAASVDGAGPVTTFVRVILPELRPVLLFTTVTSTIGTLQLFDENFILTGGGPANATLTPVLYLYRVGFQQLDFGYASAIAWVVVLIIGVLSLLQFRFLGRER